MANAWTQAVHSEAYRCGAGMRIEKQGALSRPAAMLPSWISSLNPTHARQLELGPMAVRGERGHGDTSHGLHSLLKNRVSYQGIALSDTANASESTAPLGAGLETRLFQQTVQPLRSPFLPVPLPKRPFARSPVLVQLSRTNIQSRMSTSKSSLPPFVAQDSSPGILTMGCHRNRLLHT